MPPELGKLKKKLVMEPHKSVDDIVKTLAETGGEVGENLAKFLDELPLGRKGPHRAVDAFLDGVKQGFEKTSEDITRAAEEPFKELRR